MAVVFGFLTLQDEHNIPTLPKISNSFTLAVKQDRIACLSSSF